MESFIIKGPTRLCGKVKISGSKNEALKLIPLAIALQGKVTITNVPKIKDIYSQLEIFEYLGGKYEFKNNLILDGRGINKNDIVCDASKSLRASIVYLGPLLARMGMAVVPFPGGCAIGSRPIDTHLDAFKDLGASIIYKNDLITVTLSNIKTDRIRLKEQSVSATENILIYLSCVDSDVIVENCAIEPEIIELIKVLKDGGAKIENIKERIFQIVGNNKIKIENIEVMPDRIEAGTFLIAMAATGGSGEIYPFYKDHLNELLHVLKKCEVRYKIDGNKCRVLQSNDFKPFKIETAPFPGFPTDLQSPMALIASKAKGVSIINENMFENRLNYLNNLKKLGLKYKIVNNNKAEIEGPVQLSSARVESPDLRAGITILIAAIMASGTSEIKGAQIIDRGYENIDKKLKALGADIVRKNG